MNVSNQEQKRIRLKQFLKILSEDPSLSYADREEQERPLAELLLLTGYIPANEPVDLARLVSQLLKKLGLEACSEDMMAHVMNGGTVEEFMEACK
ncbi:hypothetical protein D3C78_1288460 [compost metagenome]